MQFMLKHIPIVHALQTHTTANIGFLSSCTLYPDKRCICFVLFNPNLICLCFPGFCFFLMILSVSRLGNVSPMHRLLNDRLSLSVLQLNICDDTIWQENYFYFQHPYTQAFKIETL